ncbi:MAG: type II toxin-antitoxin system VapC family toxin [Planctomycetaceae bacterium]
MIPSSSTPTLVFATIPGSPLHQPAIAALHQLAQSGAPAWISRQVLREYLVQLTRPGVLSTPLAPSLAAMQLSALTSLYAIADETTAVTTELLSLISRGLAIGKQIHDANIVATCLAYGIPRLLTHNAGDFTRYASLIAIETL